MSDRLSKILRLLALTASDNPNEAQNAAVHTCNLLREYIDKGEIEIRAKGDRLDAAREMVSQGRGGEWVDMPRTEKKGAMTIEEIREGIARMNANRQKRET